MGGSAGKLGLFAPSACLSSVAGCGSVVGRCGGGALSGQWHGLVLAGLSSG